MSDDRPDRPPGGDRGGYAVPPQFPAPPDVRGRRPAWGLGADDPGSPPPPRTGPPLVAPEDDPATALFGPSPLASSEPDRWDPAPPGGYGGTAVLDRPTTSRRHVVAPPVRPLPPAQPAQSWDWERSHGLRNALLVAAAILLVGSLTAFVVLRNREDDRDRDFVEPPPAIEATEDTVAPGPPPGGATIVPSIVPVPVPAPSTPATAAPAPPTTAAPATAPPTAPPAPPTTRAATPPQPTVTASPPYTGGPVPTRPPSTTSTTRSTQPG